MEELPDGCVEDGYAIILEVARDPTPNLFNESTVSYNISGGMDVMDRIVFL